MLLICKHGLLYRAWFWKFGRSNINTLLNVIWIGNLNKTLTDLAIEKVSPSPWFPILKNNIEQEYHLLCL